MIPLLAWYSLLFYIPLLGGLLLGAMTLFGSGDGDGSGHGHADTSATDVHVTTGHDPGHRALHHGEAEAAPDHTPTFLAQLAAMLGFGKVPITISLMLALLIFGGTGTVLNLALAEKLAVNSSYVFLSLGGALVMMLLLAGRTSRLLGRVAPPLETYPVAKRDLIGCTAVLLNDTDEQGGYAQVRDPEGNVHNITCRTYQESASAAGEPAPTPRALAKGTQVLIIDFDPAGNRYAVEESPSEPAELGQLQKKITRPRRIATRS